MALFVSILGAAALALFSVALPDSPDASPNPSDMANVAFLTAALQLALAVLFVPPLTAPAFSAEHERGTFELLRLGCLKPRQLVASKLVASLAYLVLLMVVAAPVLMAVFLYAGIGLGQFVLVELLTLGTAVALGSVAMALSAWLPRTVTTTVATYATALALYGLAVPVGAVLGTGSTADAAAGHPLVFTNPFYALHSLVFPVPPSGAPLGQLFRLVIPGGTDAGSWGPTLQPWQASLAWQAVLGILCLLAAAELAAGRRLATRPIHLGRARAGKPSGPGEAAP